MMRVLPAVLSATILWAPAAWSQGAPTQLIPPSVTLPPPATSGGESPPATIEATPLPPPTAPGPQTAPPAQAQPGPTQPQATNPAPGAPPAQAPAAEQPAAPPQWPNTWTAEGTAVLQVLDKVEGVVKTLTVKVGQSVTYGSLAITVQACVVRPPDQPADAAAFLVIADSNKDEPGFRGWTLENEPWVSMLQNPVYDVQVLGCQA